MDNLPDSKGPYWLVDFPTDSVYLINTTLVNQSRAHL